MKIKNLFKKVVATVLAAAAIITAAAGFNSRKVEAASAHIISDEDATAVIHEDGSGFILCNREFSKEDPLTEIDGVPLKDIITFDNGGYVDEYYHVYEEHRRGSHIVFKSTETAYVHGCGPEGLFSGSGYLHFQDTEGTYDLSLWSHDVAWSSVDYESYANKIDKISWNS